MSVVKTKYEFSYGLSLSSMSGKERSKQTTIPIAPETRDKLQRLKLSDGEESWDHLLNRLYESIPSRLKATA